MGDLTGLRDILLCEHCIDALRSRGAEMMMNPDYIDEDVVSDWGLKCEWCDEEEKPLHEVVLL